MGETVAEEKAALVIQCGMRKHAAKKEVAEKKRAKQEEEDKWFEEEEDRFRNKCASKIQELFLQKLARRWRKTARRRSLAKEAEAEAEAQSGKDMEVPVAYPTSLYTPRGSNLVIVDKCPTSPYPSSLYQPTPPPPLRSLYK